MTRRFGCLDLTGRGLACTPGVDGGYYTSGSVGDFQCGGLSGQTNTETSRNCTNATPPQWNVLERVFYQLTGSFSIIVTKTRSSFVFPNTL